jgi:hypothetical protein
MTSTFVCGERDLLLWNLATRSGGPEVTINNKVGNGLMVTLNSETVDYSPVGDKILDPHKVLK